MKIYINKAQKEENSDELTDDKVVSVAEEILDKYLDAFLELAK